MRQPPSPLCVPGVRTNALETDLSDVLPEELEQAVKKAAEISMGTEIAETDIDNIRHLCQQVRGGAVVYRVIVNERYKIKQLTCNRILIFSS